MHRWGKLRGRAAELCCFILTPFVCEPLKSVRGAWGWFCSRCSLRGELEAEGEPRASLPGELCWENFTFSSLYLCLHYVGWGRTFRFRE